MLVPMHFFHTNPHGRILNRFSRDQSNADELLPITLFDTTQRLFDIAGLAAIVCVTNPYITLSIPAILACFLFLRWLSMRASRQIKRVESVTRSPVYSLLSGKWMARPYPRAC